MAAPAPEPAPVEALDTPSQEDGISCEAEAELRAYGAVLIQRATVLLRLHQSACVTAAGIFQRFFCRRSLADFDVRVTAAACLLLSCKLQQERRLKDIVVVFCRLFWRAQTVEAGPLPSHRGSFLEMRQAMVNVEKQILHELGFGVVLLRTTPHRYMLQFVRAMMATANLVDVIQGAWNYLNDSIRTTLCCQYQPHELAAASIFLAADKLGIQLPSRPPWWKSCCVSFEDLMQIATTMAALYRQPEPRWREVRKEMVDVPGFLRSPETEESAGKSPDQREASRSRSPRPKRVVRLTLGRR
ncbi:unnamed protein product [Effrenium voratum]|uniref:Cyclin-like domain-containing protein n=1 Tax=Effrenium voratum TaxID=2562239 RepID=A0AA36JB75_9DINO|nr:unnamed protein product [Effrenium voratum]CAJ1403008.1 unnamed protein product [Effrenium voratum]